MYIIHANPNTMDAQKETIAKYLANQCSDSESDHLIQMIPEHLIAIICEGCEKMNKLNHLKKKVKDTMRCPITMKRMKNPCSITVCNHTFESIALQKSLFFGGSKGNQCPLCRRKFSPEQLVPNKLLHDIASSSGDLMHHRTTCEIKKPEVDVKKCRKYREYHIIDLDGNKYTGTIKACKPHGHGQMIYKNGDTYTGTWKNGSREGYGTIRFTDAKSSDTGLWENDRIVRQCDNESRELKHYDENKLEALTTSLTTTSLTTTSLTTTSLTTTSLTERFYSTIKCPLDKNLDIKGFMKNPWTISVCSHTFEKKSITTNQCKVCDAVFNSDQIIPNNIVRELISNLLDLKSYIDDPENGHMITITNNQTHFYIYEGEIKNKKRNGYGTMIQYDGTIYTGYWKDDFISGYGKIKYTDGSKYRGQWEDHKRSGYGIYTFIEGEKYCGFWKNNERSGYGICTFADGSRYEGEWKNNSKSIQHIHR